MLAVVFPFADYWWLYLAFSALVLVLLAIDLSFHRKAHAISFREAALWTAVWVVLALAFSYGLYLFSSARFPQAVARRLSLEFLAGYIVEESLSVDNMFVFALIFRYFAIPSRYQHKVLFYGVLGAMVFRAIFIAAGSALVRFHLVMIVFGLFLIFTGVRLAIEKEKQIDPAHNLVIRWVRRYFPVTSEFHGQRLLVRLNKIPHITPLMIALLFLETTDIMFAVDSVPAVFGVTSEPLIVYTSNVFAILGLRAMYFLLSGALDRFHVLKYGLAVVLVFVGLKMAWLDDLAGGRFPIGISLAIICAVIAASIGLSFAFPKREEGAARPRTVVNGKLVRRVIGALCLILAAASLLTAAGPGRELLPFAALNQARADWLYLSGVCYLVSGVLLIRSATSPRG